MQQFLYNQFININHLCQNLAFYKIFGNLRIRQVSFFVVGKENQKDIQLIRMGCSNSNQMILLDHIKNIQNKISNHRDQQLKQLKNHVKTLQDQLLNLSKDNFYKTMDKKNLSEISILEQNKSNIYETWIKTIKLGEIDIFQKSYGNKQNTQIKKSGPSLSYDLQNLIKIYYQKLIDEKLEILNQGKILSNEFKNHLSWSIAQLNIAILQRIINDPSFQYNGVNFKTLQEFQREYLGYLKKKYPKGDNLDAGQLSNDFKEVVDFTDEYQNDILTSAGFFFESDDGFEIMQTIKLFINKLIDEANKHYKTFQSFMKEFIFNTVSKDSFVIGRKIPENISKYKRIDKNSLEIHSNEIFRILVKWIEDLQETVKNPKQKISSNSQWSFVRKYQPKQKEQKIQKVINQQKNKEKQNQQQQFLNHLESQLINCAKYYRQMFIQQGLFTKIEQLNKKQQKNNENSELQKFNISIIKGFNQVQKYSPLHLSKQEAEIIKFSEFNMKFYKQNVQKKLISLIKILVKAAKQINKKIKYDQKTQPQNTKVGLNLIKFKISDLLRCKFQGNKDEIRQVYKKFLDLQTVNKIKIIKIKNRFNTDLTDAMIIFKIIKNNQNNQNLIQQIPYNGKKNQNQIINRYSQQEIYKKQTSQQCYLICECQLILTQKYKSSNKKLTNTQTLNHYLYELERSPFKVLGQSILQLNYKYDIIKYTSKIKILQSNQNNYLCQHQFTNQIRQLQIKDQNFPMVCQKCWVFYEPYQNNQKIKACTKCFKYYCYKCSFQCIQRQKQNFDIEKPETIKQFSKDIQQKIRSRYQQYLTFKFLKSQHLLKNGLNFLQNQAIKRYQQFNNSKQIKQLNSSLGQYLNRSLHQILYNLKQFFGNKNQIKIKQLILFIYKYYHQMDYQGTIQTIFFMIMSFSKDRVILRGYKYEARNQKLINVQNQQQSYQGHQMFELNEYDTFYYPKKFGRKELSIKQSKVFLFKNCEKEIMSNQIEKSYAYCNINNINIIYYVFSKSIKKPTIQDIEQSLIRKRLVYMSNNLVDQDLNLIKLDGYRKNKSNAKKSFNQLKTINFSNNKITNISGILQDCKQLQILLLKNNKIQRINFYNSLDSLQVVELINNQISSIQGLQNLKCLKILNLKSNKLRQLFKVDESQLSKNKQNRSQIFPFLNDLNVSDNKLQFIPKIDAYKIEKIDLYNNKLIDITEFIGSYFSNLKHLNLLMNKISKIGKMGGQNLIIQEIQIASQQLEDVTEFLSSSFKNLRSLNFRNNKIDQLKLINIQLNSLEYLNLDNNKLTQFPELNAPKLKIISLQKNDIKTLSIEQIQRYKDLKQLNLSYNTNLYKIPILNSLKLQKLGLNQNKIENILDIFNYNIPNLRILNLQKSKYLTSLPNIDKFKSLYLFSISQCPIVLDNDINFIQEENTRKSKLFRVNVSIKTASQEQFQIQKLRLEENLSKNADKIVISRYKQQVIATQSHQQKKPIPNQHVIIGQQNKIIAQKETITKKQQ